jgi:hypothetical protein
MCAARAAFRSPQRAVTCVSQCGFTGRRNPATKHEMVLKGKTLQLSAVRGGRRCYLLSIGGFLRPDRASRLAAAATAAAHALNIAELDA